MSVDLHANAVAALRMVREATIISYDTETNGVDWKVNNPIGYVIGAPSSGDKIKKEDVVYVPIRHGGGGNLPGVPPVQSTTDKIKIHPWEGELAKAFEERNKNPLFLTVGHNIKFDVHASANALVYLGRNLACTQNQAALLNEYQRSYSLEACAEAAGVSAKKSTEMYAHLASVFGGPAERSQMANYWKTAGDDPVAYDYATGDGVSTFELFMAQRVTIEEEELQEVAQLENNLIWTVFRMERHGIKIDMDRVGALREATENNIRNMMESFPLGFNVRSPLAMKKVMEDNGLVDWPLTLKGNPSFTEQWLKKSEIGRKIIDIRRASNLINSFVNPLAEKHVYKGRVHATLNQLKSDDKGTISGRFSCNEPNLQQVPKRIKELAKPFRKLFVADEGHIFWERDYSQCEPRLFAHYSKDPNLLAGYNSQPFVDAHQTVANLLQVERDPTAKRMNMGIFTGMQVRAFADHMGWPVGKAEEAWNKWFEAFPGIKEFQVKAKYRLSQRGYVKTLLGRRCRLEHPRFAYRGTSKIIQGSNADIIKYKLLKADRLCEDNGDIVRVLMTVHDSFNGQFQDTEEARKLFDEMVRDMANVQCAPFNLAVPFVLEGEEGPDWCTATFGGS